MKLTEHFTLEEMQRSETAARLGLINRIPESLMLNVRRVALALETIRAHYDKPIHVTSCYRSPEVNAAVGGSKTSSHCNGEAVDFTVEGQVNVDVCMTIPFILADFDQIIYEFGPSGWVHLGMGAAMRKQLLTAVKQAGKTIYFQGIK
jgi:zinc D-Ala-D-Ala carboxypeptidase